MTSRDLEIQKIQKDWNENPRWKGVKRGYSAEDIQKIWGGNFLRVLRQAAAGWQAYSSRQALLLSLDDACRVRPSAAGSTSSTPPRHTSTALPDSGTPAGSVLQRSRARPA